MKIKESLLTVLFRQQLPVTLVALPIGCILVLFRRTPLNPHDPWLALFVLGHSVALAVNQGRFCRPDFVFLYTRGYSRDTLWLNKVLSSLLAVLAVWGAMALIVWLPLRSTFQDLYFKSPYFPLFMSKEVSVPVAWLAGYVLLLPVFFYVWIRKAQPTRGANGAALLVIGLVTTVITLMLFRWHPFWMKILISIASITVTGVSLIGGFLLHRSLEVQR